MAIEKTYFERARDFFKMGKPVVAFTIYGQSGLVTKMQTKKSDGSISKLHFATFNATEFESKNIEGFYICDTIHEAQNLLLNPKKVKVLGR
jgi:hypothetical protein